MVFVITFEGDLGANGEKGRNEGQARKGVSDRGRKRRDESSWHASGGDRLLRAVIKLNQIGRSRGDVVPVMVLFVSGSRSSARVPGGKGSSVQGLLPR